MPDEHKEMRQKSKKKKEVDMMALAPVATVRVLGNSNADHTNKRRLAACAKQPVSPLEVAGVCVVYKACGLDAWQFSEM
jgi:hypothetical protein